MLTPAVARPEDYYDSPPRERSPRCAEWLRRIDNGWRPNRRIGGMGYHESAEWYGVWVWEYLHEIMPAIARQRVK